MLGCTVRKLVAPTLCGEILRTCTHIFISDVKHNPLCGAISDAKYDTQNSTERIFMAYIYNEKQFRVVGDVLSDPNLKLLSLFMIITCGICIVGTKIDTMSISYQFPLPVLILPLSFANSYNFDNQVHGCC